MSGVHVIALVSAIATLSVIVELSRRRQLHAKYAVLWLTVGVVLAVFAVSPGLFNRLARGLGVVSPPALLSVLAALFLLMVCVYLSWEVGRLEDKTRVLAEELALLRQDVASPPVADLAPVDLSRVDRARADGAGHDGARADGARTGGARTR